MRSQQWRIASRIIRVVLLGIVLTAAACTAATQHAAGDALARKLSEFEGAERGQVSALTTPSLSSAFPHHRFYVLRFSQYPVAVDPPAPLQANNLFVVEQASSAERIQDTPSLQRFFQAKLRPVTTREHAVEAMQAWLRLVEEFHQDGFFRFSIPDDTLRVTTEPDGLTIVGKALVNRQGGNAGQIAASLSFDANGRLLAASETPSLKRGIRPICQATKLLDPDPIVRGMAEQSLLVLGRAAQAYLEEQRAVASPELRAAIDRLWKRIVSDPE